MVPHAKSRSGPPVGAARKQRAPTRGIEAPPPHAPTALKSCDRIRYRVAALYVVLPGAVPRSGPVPCRAVAQFLPQLEARAELDAHRAQVLVRDEVQDAQLDLLAPEHLNLENKRTNERTSQQKTNNQTSDQTNKQTNPKQNNKQNKRTARRS